MNRPVRESAGERLLFIIMRWIITFFLFLCVFYSNAQTVNRYYKPPTTSYVDTYEESIDWETLFEMTKVAKQAKERNFIKQWLNQYNSFENFPQTILDGWHPVIIIDYDNLSVLEAEMYVLANEVYYLRVQKRTITVNNLPIVQGVCKTNSSVAFFYKELLKVNR